ncbi:hypothetical protein D5086_001103 [Populus alba]|uniref:Uncharacterized protein n=1 Tax=Populus alba TaxID=43335 RepID=A0ACC4CZ11_POPAL
MRIQSRKILDPVACRDERVTINLFSEFCKIKKLNPSNRISSDSRSESRSGPKMDLSHFVLHLKGEGELVDLMMTNNFDVTDHWLQRGKKKQPKYLIEMLEKSTVAEEVARCGSLKTVPPSTKDVLKGLADAAKNRFEDFKKTQMNQCEIESPSKWPLNVLAANSMYRITQTILQNYEGRNNLMGEILFKKFEARSNGTHQSVAFTEQYEEPFALDSIYKEE